MKEDQRVRMFSCCPRQLVILAINNGTYECHRGTVGRRSCMEGTVEVILAHEQFQTGKGKATAHSPRGTPGLCSIRFRCW
jgi:hypothetical protein